MRLRSLKEEDEDERVQLEVLGPILEVQCMEPVLSLKGPNDLLVPLKDDSYLASRSLEYRSILDL